MRSRAVAIPRASVFERFERLHTGDDRDVYGHGLGLHMVRQLLRAMNSDVALEPSERGAVFAFTLPIAEVADDD